MAELAAGAVLAEELVTNTAMAGVGVYKLGQPTMPLKASFNRIATSSSDETRLSLTRSGHSLSIIGNKAYVFGGETVTGKLASTDIHAVTIEFSGKPEAEYSVIPPIPDIGSLKTPVARTEHAACAFNVCVAVFGGLDERHHVVDEDARIWLFNTNKSAWESLQAAGVEPKPQSRSGAHLLNHKNNLVLYGGRDANGIMLRDVWIFKYVGMTWHRLPEAPVTTTSAACADGSLYLVSGSDSVSSDLHSLQLDVKEGEQHSWAATSFPTNPLTPGPQPRAGAGLLHVSTGYGRNYLLYLFGARRPAERLSSNAELDNEAKDAEPQYWSDAWTYQLPSSSPEAKPTLSISDAIKPAAIKDAIRSTLGFDSGKHSWCEVEVQPPTDMEASEGKVHPGPRGFFGCDVMEDGHSVVLWGGINAKGEKEGDAWLIRLSH